MKKASKRANGDGTIYFDEKQKTWRAEIQWVDIIKIIEHCCYSND